MGGVFANPTSPKSPAKLRLSFEAAPVALLVERAGGKSSDGSTGCSLLDVVISGVDQRTALCVGSASEVERFNAIVLGVGSASEVKHAIGEPFIEGYAEAVVGA